MTDDQPKLRKGERNYHDRVFEEEVYNLVNITQKFYEEWVFTSCPSAR